MIIERTNSENEDFRKLVLELKNHLTNADEEAHAECIPYNSLESIRHVIVTYNDKIAVGCGAIRELEQDTVEIKRMFVSENAREKGIGTKILTELETWARELGYKKSILETGYMLPKAISLYKKSGYVQIPNYG